MLTAVQIVDYLLNAAFKQRASDIHLEPTQQEMRARFRIDGILHDQQSIAQAHAVQVTARVKILASLDVAEKRTPQDGKFTLEYLKEPFDLRVATFPSLYGEKVVIRILQRSLRYRALTEIGLSESIHKKLLQLIRRTTGLFLVTGPTGSGKTTTLYAALTTMYSPEKNVVTLEDPIEYTMAGITQGQVHPDSGFTFARGIRAILRQDPDIIMVGEIRDKETADVAIQAALTGHLVMSTSHTNDACGTVMRLLDMGTPSFLINATLAGVLAQRLVRVLCTHCRYQTQPTPLEYEFLENSKISIKQAYRATGCAYCSNRCYTGRIGIFELLTITNPLRTLIRTSVSHDLLYQEAFNDGMQPLLNDAVHKIEQGITTIAEVMRVI